MKKSWLFTAATVASLSVGAVAQAAPMIGFSPDGVHWYYASTWSNFNDTGVDVDKSGDGDINNLPVGEPHTFSGQFAVSGMTAAGSGAVRVPGLNSLFEITKELTLNEEISYNSGPTFPRTVISTATAGTPPQPAVGMTIYYDNIDDGSYFIQGDGANTVRCYGSGNNNGSAPCVTDPTAPVQDGDGIPIMKLSLISNTTTFTASANGIGTGSFDIRWKIDWWDPNHINVSQLIPGSIIGEKLIGTINQPIDQNPLGMWNGTPVAGNTPFSVTSSETFFAEAPEPSSLLLLGAGLFGLGSLPRIKRKAY